MAWVCNQLSDVAQGQTQTCVQWVEQKVNVFDELNAIPHDVMNVYLFEIVAFWLLCWMYKALGDFIAK